MYQMGLELDELIKKKRIEDIYGSSPMGILYNPINKGYEGAMHSKGMYQGLVKTAINDMYSKGPNPLYNGMLTPYSPTKSKGLYGKLSSSGGTSYASNGGTVAGVTSGKGGSSGSSSGSSGGK